MKAVVRLLGCLVLAMSLGTLLGTPTPLARATEHAAVLTAFSAKAKPGAKVKLKWETGTETTVLGFNVWRATKQNGKFKKLNANPIDAKNAGGITGETYAYTDKTVQAGKNYFYKVEVVKVPPPNEWSEVKKVTAKP
jgi:hypothetical protein